MSYFGDPWWSPIPKPQPTYHYVVQPQYVYGPAVNQGWECPKCKSVYAPHVTKCEKCGS